MLKGTTFGLKGSALIGVVVAILIFSVLAAAIVPIISSSGQQTAAGEMAAKAYLLAESGFRFAASKYLHALPHGGNDALEGLEGEYPLSDGNSRFRLVLFSYFCEAQGALANGDTSFNAHFPGSRPDDCYLNNGLSVLIGEELKPENIYTINGAAAVIGGEEDRVTLTISPPIASANGYPDATRIYPLAYPDDSRTPAVSQGGRLAYHSGDGAMFPLRNGRIRVGDRFLTYRFNDRDHDRFVDVRDPDDDTMTGFPIDGATPIVLTPFARVEATGIYGSGAMQARRQVTYHAPLPLTEPATRTIEFTERFDTRENWRDAQGTTIIGQVNGNTVLKVESTQANGSLTVFSPATEAAAAVDFNDARRGTRGYLSYDAQVKIGFEAQPAPDLGFFPTPPVPASFAAGLSFRLSNAGNGIFNSNGYGLSFLRGNSGDSGIPDEILPVADQRAIVLWQQAGNDAQRDLLAYKAIPIVFPLPLQNFDSNGGGWTPSNAIWQHVPGTPNGTPAWFCDYNAPGANNGTLESPAFDIPADYPQTTLTLRSWLQTDSNDTAEIRIRVDGEIVKILSLHGRDHASWNSVTLSLSEFGGETLDVQFYFERVGSMNAALQGWYIDDARIQCEWPVENATLGVRLKEAMVVRFHNGHPPIKAGSRIYGHDRNTMATIMTAPLLISGDWTEASPAQGVLLLNRPSVISGQAFNNGEVLTVIGGNGRAEVENYNPTSDRKANIIQVFYASETGGGNGGNTNPLDCNTRPYPANHETAWPPEVNDDGNWTINGDPFIATQDYFRLIEWDYVSDSSELDNTILQSHHADLQSPDYPNSDAEIGLHAFGDGAENVYFDDFSLLIDVARYDVVPHPLQE